MSTSRKAGRWYCRPREMPWNLIHAAQSDPPLAEAGARIRPTVPPPGNHRPHPPLEEMVDFFWSFGCSILGYGLGRLKRWEGPVDLCAHRRTTGSESRSEILFLKSLAEPLNQPAVLLAGRTPCSPVFCFLPLLRSPAGGLLVAAINPRHDFAAALIWSLPALPLGAWDRSGWRWRWQSPQWPLQPPWP